MFSKTLVRLAKKDPRIILLTGDHGYALFDSFREQCPSQYVNCGIAEQNMVSMAAGLAKIGYKPYVYGLAAFIPLRVLEQIKMDVAHENLPITLIGDGAGMVYGQLGSSHQSLEDIGVLRSLPNICILSPSDRYELEALMEYSLLSGAANYLRFGKSDRGDVHRKSMNISDLKKPICVHKDQTARSAIISTGSMVITAVKVAKKIGSVNVYSMPILKGYCSKSLKDILQVFDNIIILEEHYFMGGLGSIIFDEMKDFKSQFLHLAIKNEFNSLCGDYDFLIDNNGLSEEKIENEITSFLNFA
jgi:transketolase